jgi:hypothetical protein
LACWITYSSGPVEQVHFAETGDKLSAVAAIAVQARKAERDMRTVTKHIFPIVTTVLALGSTIVLTLPRLSIAASAQWIIQYSSSQTSAWSAHLSTDTTPVKIKVGSIIYHIPRNYLEYPDQDRPVLEVTYPGFRPYSEETRWCFEQKLPNNGPAACRTIQFILGGSTGPGPGGRAFTNGEMFENIMRNSPGLKPRNGPFGYQIYERVPYPNHEEIYRREEGNILFECFISDENDRDKNSVCNDYFALDDGNHVHAFLYPHQIAIVPEFETAIRKIVAGFKHESLPH